MNDDTYQRICHLIDDSDLERVADTLKNWLIPAVRLESHPTSHQPLPIGSSKLGGQPDLPTGIPWPVYDGEPMAFLAQINLSQIAPYDTQHLLPPTGILSFFQKSQDCFEGVEYNPLGDFSSHETEAWSVLYTEAATESLKTRNYPEALPAAARFPESLLTAAPMWTLPDDKSLLADTLNLDEEEEERLRALRDSISDRFGDNDEIYHLHQLLGHPPLLQSDMQQECYETTIGKHFGYWPRLTEPQRSELLSGASQWTHLLQIDTDANARLTWGEVGFLSFWIRRDDLAELHFDRCLAIMQSL